MSKQNEKYQGMPLRNEHTSYQALRDAEQIARVMTEVNGLVASILHQTLESLRTAARGYSAPPRIRR